MASVAMVQSGAFMNRPYAPGVHFRETSGLDGPAPFRTGVPVFIGRSKDADASGAHEFFFASRWEDFESRVSDAHGDGYLGPAVRGFFENGGQRCAIVTVPRPAALETAFSARLGSARALEDLEEIDLVCMPDAMLEDEKAVYRMQQAALEHCARTNRLAILDSFPIVQAQSTQAPVLRVLEQRDRFRGARAGALYFPWLGVATAPSATASAPQVANGARAAAPFSGGRNSRRLVPPCGHIAGVYARVDNSQGARKAPANEILEGVVDLEMVVGEDQRLQLNELGINCVRSFIGRGIRVYGARTLSGQPNWRFVNVARLFATLARWMTHRLSDVVFEPHSPALWGDVRDRLNAYCRSLLEQGALQGPTPEQAFFVKCDAETNPAESRDNGMLVAEVGLAALAPAEFIVVRVNQRASGVSFTPLTGH